MASRRRAHIFLEAGWALANLLSNKRLLQSRKKYGCCLTSVSS